MAWFFVCSHKQSAQNADIHVRTSLCWQLSYFLSLQQILRLTEIQIKFECDHQLLHTVSHKIICSFWLHLFNAHSKCLILQAGLNIITVEKGSLTVNKLNKQSKCISWFGRGFLVKEEFLCQCRGKKKYIYIYTHTQTHSTCTCACT